MELFNQPFSGAMGDKLKSILNSDIYDELKIFVAFAKESAVLRIKKDLDYFRRNGRGKITAYVGIDLEGTSYEALSSLLTSVDSLNIVHATTSQTFHPKIYDFTNRKEGLTIVGSHNLTVGGLWGNFESSIIADTDLSQPDGIKLRQSVSDYINGLKSLGASFQVVPDQQFIDDLLKAGEISKEALMYAKSRSTQNTSSQSKKASSIFGKGKPVALPPSPSKSVQHPSATNNNLKVNSGAIIPPTPQVPTGSSVLSANLNDPILWYSTRALTGGSSNQIDLSKESLVSKGNPNGTPFAGSKPHLMRGAVEFFGVQPNLTGVVTKITIHYQGQDYYGNTIKYPDNLNANQTWRLQLEGKDKNGNNLVFLYGKGGLKKKILTFTKIAPDYFSLGVYPESDLQTFYTDSILCGYNGRAKNARPIGYIF